MDFPRGTIKAFLVLFLIVAGHIATVEAGPKDRFSVAGWVVSKLSPAKNARSASRSERLRPVPVNLNQPPASPQLAMAAAYPTNPPLSAPPQPRQVSHPAPPPPSTSSIGNGRASSSRANTSRRQQSRSSHLTGERSVAELRRRAEFLASKGLTYKFGGDHPNEGGMDCSGTMQFLLKSMGYSDIPRTSYNQYAWLKEKGTLRNVGFFRSADRAIGNFRAGDMIFWGGTYDSGHKVSHVMIYLGKNRNGKHYIFGARGKKVKGLNGSGVDVFEYNPRSTGGRLIGYGRLPGLKG